MATAVQIPQPLTSEEIREGLALRMSAMVPDLTEDEARELKGQIERSLEKTCSLNRSMYSKFKASWRIWHGWKEHGTQFGCWWWVDYELDDFGRVTKGGIGGKVSFGGEHVGIMIEGSVDEMPPDRFRRETRQPVPQPTVIKKPEPNQGGMSHTPRGAGKRKDA